MVLVIDRPARAKRNGIDPDVVVALVFNDETLRLPACVSLTPLPLRTIAPPLAPGAGHHGCRQRVRKITEITGACNFGDAVVGRSFHPIRA